MRAHVVGLMARRGVRCTEDEVFITSGAQQAMCLLGQLLVSPGDSLVTEELTYDGMLGALRPLQPRVLTVPSRPGTGWTWTRWRRCWPPASVPPWSTPSPRGTTRWAPACRPRSAGAWPRRRGATASPWSRTTRTG